MSSLKPFDFNVALVIAAVGFVSLLIAHQLDEVSQQRSSQPIAIRHQHEIPGNDTAE